MSDSRDQRVGTTWRGPRRWIPWSFLVVMTLLAAGSWVASLHSAPRFSYFAPPPSGDPRVVSIFHTVVSRTLDEPSFRVDNVIDYQSPDLFQIKVGVPPSLRLIEVGHELYFPIDVLAPIPLWGRASLSSNVARNLRIGGRLALLTTLLHADSVVRDGGSNFTVTTVESASAFDPVDAGQVQATMTVYVNDDLVSSVVTVLRGWMTVDVISGSPPRTRSMRVSTSPPLVSTYGDFGHVARISAPPYGETTPVIICDNGEGYKIQTRGHCITF